MKERVERCMKGVKSGEKERIGEKEVICARGRIRVRTDCYSDYY